MVKNGIAVLGTGPMDRRNACALFRDATNAIDAPHIILTTAHFQDAARYAADWVSEVEGGTLTVYDHGMETEFLPEDYEQVNLHSTDDPVGSIIKSLGHGGTVLYAWEDHDSPEQEQEVERLLAAGLQVFDLSDGLFPITSDDEEGGETQPPAEEPQEAPAAPEKPVEEPVAPKPRATKPKAEKAAEPAPDEAQQTPNVQAGEPDLMELGRAVKVLLDYIAAHQAARG